LTFSLLMLNLQPLLPTTSGDLTFCLVERRSISPQLEIGDESQFSIAHKVDKR